MEFPEKLNALAADRRLSQGDLAGTLGVAKSTINNWFKGRCEPSLGDAFALARAFGVPLDYFADDSAGRPPEGPGIRRRTILEIVGAIGEQEALRRLLLVPEPPALGVSVHRIDHTLTESA